MSGIDRRRVRTDEHGNPVGQPVDGWVPRPAPPRTPMLGKSVSLVAVDAGVHAADLFDAFSEPADFTYLFHEPFADRASLTAWLQQMAASDDPLLHTLLVDGRAVGVAAFLRIDQQVGSIEVGSIHFSPALQRTVAATEAMFLMMQRAFDLGYRRYEWKCDALNAPSRAAATRLGFSFEGIFRQAVVYKGRNRDTAWFSIIDSEWPVLRDEFVRWLDPANFDADGNQLTRLECRSLIERNQRSERAR